MGERVAAIVVTYNRKTLLTECLDALLGQSRQITRIFVVDNASTDGTAEMLRDKGYLSDPVVEYIRAATNQGGSAGFCIGIKAALERDLDWFWLMDDDAEPARDALERLLGEGLEAREDTVALANLTVGKDGQVQILHRGRFLEKPLRWEPLALAEYQQEVCPIGYASFVGILVRASAVRQIGLPQSGFFVQADDVEYSYRLFKQGKLYLVSRSVIYHKDMATWLGPRDRRRITVPVQYSWRNYYAIRNTILMLKMHEKSRRFRIQQLLLMMLWNLRQSVGFILFDDYKVWRLRLIWVGYAHGLAGLMGRRVDPVRRVFL